MNNQNTKSYAPLYLLGAGILIVSGLWSYHWLQRINYSEETFRIISQEQFDIQNVRGYIVYLDFWASWCAPCRQSFPWMQQMRQRYADKGFRILAVNLDQTEEAMAAFLQQYQVDFTIIADPSYSLFRRFRITGIPTSILFDTEGNEIWRHQGFRQQQEEKYEQVIIQALSES